MPALLQTKLYTPSIRSNLVSRYSLLTRLNDGLWLYPAVGRAEFTRKLTLIAAPAGFGKTTLAAEWLTDLRLPILDLGLEAAFDPASPKSQIQNPKSCWLSLDESDNDPTRFLAYLIATLQRAIPELGQVAQATLSLADAAAVEGILTLLLNDVAAAPQPLILVLDDYHVLRGETVKHLLSLLVERQPPSLHLVIISRTDPDLPLSRLRVRGQLVELRARDLRFTETEIADFFGQTMGLRLESEWIAALEQRTEGWIAGLQLAALSLQGRDDPAAFIEAFSGSHHYVIDYLVDEVLRQQPPEVRDFLMQTAILGRLCGALCDAVLLTTNSQAMLEHLERANLFLVPLDDQREWYRYHHLFADTLLVIADPTQQAVLHRRAAVWHADHHLLPQAVRHALTAQDFELAADLLGATGREAALWSNGEFRRYCEWVQQVPEAIRRSRPRLQLMYARALQLIGQLDEAERLLAEVAQAIQSTPDTDPGFAAIAEMYQAHCQLERGAIQTAHALAQSAATYLLTGAPLDRVRARHCIATTAYGLGDLNTALSLFVEVSQTTLSQSAAMNAAECAARTLAQQGRLRDAVQQCAQLFTAARVGSTYNVLAAGAFVTLGEVYYQQNLLEQVPAVLQQGIELADRLSPRALVRAHQVWAYLQFARLYQAQGHRADMEDALRKADQIAQEIQNTFYLRLAALRQKALALGREHRVPLLERVRVYMPVAFSYLDEYETWIAVHIALAQGNRQLALTLLDQALNVAQRMGRGFSVMEIQVWRAQLLHQLRQRAGAQAALTEALVAGAPEEHIRVFLDAKVDAGATLCELLTSVRAVAPGHVACLLAALSETSSQAPARTQALPPQSDKREYVALNLQLEPLSSRELEILTLLAAGLSNQAIGQKLFIGVGTVKWYLTNLYDKLDVSSRTQAVARAREVGLLA